MRGNSTEEIAMTFAQYTRRDFSRVISQSLAFAFMAPALRAAPSVNPTPHATAPGQPGKILLNFNENPYGPTPKGLESLSACGHAATRYPDSVYEEVRDTLAAMHGVKRENIVLGCGSTEILR